MKDVVLNATPLIYMTKTGFSNYFKELSLNLFTTTQVIEEVLSKDFPEQPGIKQLIIDKIILPEQVSISREFLLDELGIGEASALTLAKEKKAPLISDDKAAISIGKMRNVDVFHSTFLLFRAVKKNVITKSNAVACLNNMIDSGWYCDIQTYNQIRKLIEGH